MAVIILCGSKTTQTYQEAAFTTRYLREAGIQFVGMSKREAASGGLSQDRSRRRSTLSNYSNKRLTKTDMVVECLEATPHEAVALPALHSYLQENIARLTATSLTWVHDIKAACDLELAKPTSRIAELPGRPPRGPPAYKLRLQHVLRSATARYPAS